VTMITKSDFFLFLDSPIHFWAKVNNRAVAIPLSLLDQHLRKHGKEIERLVKSYIYEFVVPRYADAEVLWQPTYRTEELEVRADAVIYDREFYVYDIYTNESVTSMDKDYEIDVTFQSIVYETNLRVRDIFLVQLNKEYVRKGEINIEEMFSTVYMNQLAKERKDEVSRTIQEALLVANLTSPESLETCSNPSDCVCPDICHPNLQPDLIFDINGTRMIKTRE